jgi:hypothetical protein
MSKENMVLLEAGSGTLNANQEKVEKTNFY